MEEEKSFGELATIAGLKQTSLNKLAKEDLDTCIAIREMTEDDVRAINLTRGQTGALQRWIKKLRDVEHAETPAVQPQQSSPGNVTPVTTQSLSKDTEIQNLLDRLTSKGRPETGIWTGTDTLLGDQPRTTDNRPTGMIRPLLITDYISKSTSGSQTTDEHELCNQGSTKLLVRAKQTILPEHVTLPQWISANARIMSKMISEGQLANMEDIIQYLQYVQDFGDYAQVCDQKSLMVYDNEYRIKQAKRNSTWGDDDVHLATFYLRRQTEIPNIGGRTFQRRQERPPRLLDPQGIEICRNYNAFGCNWKLCRYSHVCSICKEKGHTKSKHT